MAVLVFLYGALWNIFSFFCVHQYYNIMTMTLSVCVCLVFFLCVHTSRSQSIEFLISDKDLHKRSICKTDFLPVIIYDDDGDDAKVVPPPILYFFSFFVFLKKVWKSIRAPTIHAWISRKQEKKEYYVDFFFFGSLSNSQIFFSGAYTDNMLM